MGRNGAGGDEDMLRRDGPGILPGDLDAAGSCDAGAAAQERDLRAAEQALDAAAERLRNFVLVAVQRRKVEARAICADARAVVRIAPDLRGVQQSLRRHTAAVQAGAAALAVLNNSRMQAKLRGAQRGGIAAGARADDDELIVCHRHSFQISCSPSRAHRSSAI